MLRKQVISRATMGEFTHFYAADSFEVDGIVYTPPQRNGHYIKQPMFQLKDQNVSFRGHSLPSERPVHPIHVHLRERREEQNV